MYRVKCKLPEPDDRPIVSISQNCIYDNVHVQYSTILNFTITSHFTI